MSEGRERGMKAILALSLHAGCISGRGGGRVVGCTAGREPGRGVAVGVGVGAVSSHSKLDSLTGLTTR